MRSAIAFLSPEGGRRNGRLKKGNPGQPEKKSNPGTTYINRPKKRSRVAGRKVA